MCRRRLVREQRTRLAAKSSLADVDGRVCASKPISAGTAASALRILDSVLDVADATEQPGGEGARGRLSQTGELRRLISDSADLEATVHARRAWSLP
jgi:hypothetical protein